MESWKPSALLAVVVAAAILIGGWLQASSLDTDSVPGTNQDRVVPAATPQPAALSSAPGIVPDVPVAFKVCREISGYRKLTRAEMQSVFTNRRFGDGTKPGPFYWAIYESDFYWIQEPHAISANVENVALSRGTTTSGTPTNAQADACFRPDGGQYESFQALGLYDHHVVAMRADSGVLTVEVERTPGTWEGVEFPDPAPPRSLPPAKTDPLTFTGLRIVDGAGHVLVSRGAQALVSELDESGKFVSGTLTSYWPLSTLNLRVAAYLEFICGEAPRGAAALTLTPAGGASMTVQAAACSGAWEVAARAHLEPGDWTIGVDGDAYYIVLPKDGPRP